jgi:4'-phosphopantetheinyl transferase
MTIVVHHGVHLTDQSPPVRSAGSIEVWTIALDDASRWGNATDVLSSDEIARAHTFRSVVHQRRFMTAHTALRSILANYLGIPPASIVFTPGHMGKPMLDPSRHGAGLCFGLAHSHEIALVVVAREREVGVDLERIRPISDVDGIVAKVFSPAERAAFSRVPPDRRLDAFLRWWTSKEAYVKACGDGLSQSLAHVEITFAVHEDAATVRVLDRPDDGRRWRLFTFVPDMAYVAAVAVQADDEAGTVPREPLRHCGRGS